MCFGTGHVMYIHIFEAYTLPSIQDHNRMTEIKNLLSKNG